MQLSVIIVNYKQAALALQCIESVYLNATGQITFELILVDNGSDDHCRSIVLQKFPEVIFIQMGYNSGFARANNAGIQIAKGEAVLLLNSDTKIAKNTIDRCFEEFMSSEYAACGVQLLNEDMSPQISGNFAMKGGLNYLLPLPYVGHILKSVSSVFKIRKPNVPEACGVVEVDWINGAFLMVKRSAFEKAGLLDEAFFLYAEEAEWCSRIKKNGKLCIYGHFNVVHLQGESSNEAFESTGKGYFNLFDRKGLQIMTSNFLRIRKEFGLGWFLFDLFIYLSAVPYFFIGNLFSLFLPASKRKYTFRQWRGFTKNIFQLILLSKKMILNEKYFYKVL